YYDAWLRLARRNGPLYNISERQAGTCVACLQNTQPRGTLAGLRGRVRPPCNDALLSMRISHESPSEDFDRHAVPKPRFIYSDRNPEHFRSAISRFGVPGNGRWLDGRKLRHCARIHTAIGLGDGERRRSI